MRSINIFIVRIIKHY